jgi:hypothetical protein
MRHPRPDDSVSLESGALQTVGETHLWGHDGRALFKGLAMNGRIIGADAGHVGGPKAAADTGGI